MIWRDYYLLILTHSQCKWYFWKENIHDTQNKVARNNVFIQYWIWLHRETRYHSFPNNYNKLIILIYKGISIPFREFSCNSILYMNTRYNIEIIGNILQQNILPANIRIQPEEFIAHSSLSCSVSLIIWIWHMYRWRPTAKSH